MTMLWVGGDPPSPQADPTAGVYRIDAPARRASYRFTSPKNETVEAVWIHIGHEKLPGDTQLRVELMQDGAGLPVPFQTTPGPADALFEPAEGWQRVVLTQSAAVIGCETYHLVLEPGTSAEFTANQYVELHGIVSRYPLAYQAEDPSTAQFRSSFDLDHAFMFEAPPLPLLSQWIEGDFVIRPFFAIECSDDTIFGQPYDGFTRPKVLGDFLWGQKLVLSASRTVNHVAVFSETVAGIAHDKLQAEIWDAATSPPTLLAKGFVVDPRPNVMIRAHWFGGRIGDPQGFPIDLVLPAGAYYLAVRSIPVEGAARGYLISMVESSLPVPLGTLDPSFGAVQSHAVMSPDGGSSWFSTPGAPDMAFMLSKLVDVDDVAFGIFDEGQVNRTPVNGGGPALTASSGETLVFSMVTRNIGLAEDRLVYDFFDPDQGISLLNPPGPRVDDPSTPRNSDTPNEQQTPSLARNVEISVPSGLVAGDRWKVLMRVGHQRSGPPTELIIDDEVLWEIRIQ